ncbi:MAG: hypothetical protein MZW92_66285 [Comamonadaceae bacterium]|nr:hypothetical protein [Comamonadaceae bacterium]
MLLAIAEPGHPVRLLAAFATELMGRDAQAVLALSRDEAELLRAVARFTGYRDAWLERGFGFMLRQWMEAEGVARRLLARADGERRLTNLLHLGELLHQAAVSHAGPEALLRWLADRRREAVSSEDAQLRLESDRNLVQIVTIHKAKGLEYEVVFCPFLWDGLRVRRGESEGASTTTTRATASIDFRPEAADDEDIKRRRREEADAEFVRLAYVALTRAVQRCYLVAGCYLFKAGRGDPTPHPEHPQPAQLAGGGQRSVP